MNKKKFIKTQATIHLPPPQFNRTGKVKSIYFYGPFDGKIGLTHCAYLYINSFLAVKFKPPKYQLQDHFIHLELEGHWLNNLGLPQKHKIRLPLNLNKCKLKNKTHPHFELLATTYLYTIAQTEILRQATGIKWLSQEYVKNCAQKVKPIDIPITVWHKKQMTSKLTKGRKI